MGAFFHLIIDKTFYFIYYSMILLNKDEINRVIVTASENVTIPFPVYFLFEVISDDTLSPKYFTAADISSNSCRYNEFLIEVTTGTEDLTTGVINLPLSGYYKYNIYQQDIEFNVDPSLAGDIVETGKLYLRGEDKPDTTKYTNNDNNNYITYNNG